MELHEVGVRSEGQVARCKYKLRSVRRGEEGEDGPRKRGPKPRLRSAGMSRLVSSLYSVLVDMFFSNFLISLLPPFLNQLLILPAPQVQEEGGECQGETETGRDKHWL